MKWTKEDICGLDMAFLATEIDENGRVSREIGVDEAGEIIHKFPSEGFRGGEAGLFDLQLVETANLEGNMEPGAFEALWSYR